MPLKPLMHWIMWKLWDERFFILILILIACLFQKLFHPL